MTMRTILISLSWLFVSASFAGCLHTNENINDQGNTIEDELQLPIWTVGDEWLYSFSTPQFGEDSARLVVAEVDEENGVYQLGISSEREAQRHAVINHNPFIGRVTMDGLSVYEEGEPQGVFHFPWRVQDSWSFTLFGQDWSAVTTSIYDGVVTVDANSAEGHKLTYEFNGRNGFLSSFIWSDEEEIEQLRMVLTQSKTGYKGDVYFYRARDLVDNLYLGQENDVYDTFLDDGHPNGQEWDVLVWYLNVEIDGGGTGSLTLKDHEGGSPLTRFWGAGATERGAIGTIPSLSGEYSLTVTLQGQDSMVHLKIAGAIKTQWTL